MAAFAVTLLKIHWSHLFFLSYSGNDGAQEAQQIKSIVAQSGTESVRYLSNSKRRVNMIGITVDANQLL